MASYRGSSVRGRGGFASASGGNDDNSGGGFGQKPANDDNSGFGSNRGGGRGGSRGGGSSGFGGGFGDNQNSDGFGQRTSDSGFGSTRGGGRGGSRGGGSSGFGGNDDNGGGFGHKPVNDDNSGFGSNRGGGRGGSRGGRGGSSGFGNNDDNGSGFGQRPTSDDNSGFGSNRGGGRGGSRGGGSSGFGGGFGDNGNSEGFGQSSDNGFGSARGGSRGGGRGGRGGSSGFGNNDDNGGFGQRSSSDDNGFGSNRGGGRGGSRGGRGGGFGGGDEGFGQKNDDDSAPSFGGRGGGRSRGGGGSGFGAPPSNAFGGNTVGDGERAGDGPASNDQDSPSDLHKASTYVPVNREIDEIFKEDVQSAELYSNIFNDDEDVLLEGQEGELAVVEDWKDIKLDPKIVENIARANYIRPRKIQAFTIPVILEGRDLKGQAETGSGKSAAFLIPMINFIINLRKENEEKKLKTSAIIIEPTRELAIQLYEQGKKLAYETGVQVVKCYGEYNFRRNAEEILLGCDIVVGTPGRLLHMLQEGIVETEGIKFLVLDEADRLLDQQFNEIIKKMQEIRGFPTKSDRQTLLFSATFPPEVENFAQEILKSDRVFVHSKNQLSANAKVTQSFIDCDKAHKKPKVLELLQQAEKEVKARDPEAPSPRALVFVQLKRDADIVALYLCGEGLKAVTVNGDRTQSLREEALNSFRSNKTPIMVATDVCARGLDIKDLDCVINMDLPIDVVTYVHRIGRTGRLKKGKAINLVDKDSKNDQTVAGDIIKLLEEDGNEVPQCLKDAADSLGGSGDFGGGGGGFGAVSGGFGGGGSGFGGGAGFGGESQGFGGGNGFDAPTSFGGGKGGFDSPTTFGFGNSNSDGF